MYTYEPKVKLGNVMIDIQEDSYTIYETRYHTNNAEGITNTTEITTYNLPYGFDERLREVLERNGYSKEEINGISESLYDEMIEIRNGIDGILDKDFEEQYDFSGIFVD